MLTTFTSFRLISSDLGKSIARTSSQPVVAREIDYYNKTIGSIKSIDAFVKNDRVFKFAMKSFGLEDMNYAKAFMKKMLSEGVESRTAMANRLSDKRYGEFVKAFNFARYGELTTTFAATRAGAVDRYVRQTLEETAGAQNEGVRLALYFQRKASSVTSAYGILADPALLKVAQTVLGLPVGQKTDVDATAKLIEQRMKIADLKDPAKVQKLLQRFTAIWDANTSVATSSIAPIFGGSAQGGMSLDLLYSLQKLKR
ncbi:MAG: DUF1217 domain-containing protein [Beijerinckiaceae bacterium]|nr:DUF1217 domain-containing protein [Beijerinckiaceae bacterium]